MLLQKLLVTVHERWCVFAYYIGAHHLEKFVIYMHRTTKNTSLFNKKGKQKASFNIKSSENSHPCVKPVCEQYSILEKVISNLRSA